MSNSWCVRNAQKSALAGICMAVAVVIHVAAPSAVAQPTWKAPVPVSMTGESADAAALAVSPDGVLSIAEEEGVGGFDQAALYRSRPFGGQISAPTVLSSSASHINGIDIAVDARGNLAAVWTLELPGPVSRVEGAFKPAGGAFGAPAVLSTTDISVQRPEVEFDGQGNAVVIWQQTAVKDGIFFQTKPAGSDFPPIASATRLSNPANDAGNFGYQLASGPSGDIYAIYTESEGGVRRVRSNHRPSGGSFATSRLVNDQAIDLRKPTIVVTPAGGSIAAWVRDDTFAIQAATSSAGGSYSSATQLSSAGATSDSVQIASDGSGGASAVWIQNDGGTFEAFESYQPPSGTFPAAGQRLSGAGVPNVDGVKVGASVAGATVVSWTEEVAGDDRRLARYRTSPGNPFGSQTLIDSGSFPASGTGGSPIFDAQGNAFELVFNFDGVNRNASLACLDAAGPQLTVDPPPPEVVAGKPAKFEQHRKDQCSSIASNTWNMGDGSAVLTTTAVVHTYGKPGTFKQTAEATDDVQNASSIQRDVVVKPAPLNVSLVRTSKLRPTRSGSYRIRVNTSAPARFGIKATVVKRIKRRRGKRVRTVRKSVTVASGTGIATKAGVQLVGFKPNRAGKALIRRAGRSGLKVSLALNADGQGIAATRRVSAKGSTRLIPAKRK